MVVKRAFGALVILCVFLFFAGLAWTGPIDDGVGRYQGVFALVVNGTIGQLGEQGAAGIFAGLGLLFGALVWFRGRL